MLCPPSTRTLVSFSAPSSGCSALALAGTMVLPMTPALAQMRHLPPMQPLQLPAPLRQLTRSLRGYPDPERFHPRLV